MLVCEVVLINSLTLDGVSAKHFVTTADSIILLSHSGNNDGSVYQSKQRIKRHKFFPDVLFTIKHTKS